LYVVGLGPGSPDLLTPEASSALEAADVVVGYHGYLDLIADRIASKERVGLDLGKEVERAEVALELAEAGRAVALVSSGDAGVYGMGGVALELAAARDSQAAIEVIPGVTAALAAAARLGAPLAHDWACISLSDLLTPWPVVEKRLTAAAESDMVVVLYNPKSRGRSTQLALAARCLARGRGPKTPVGLVENASRPGERVEIVTLGDLIEDGANVTMFTTVVVGSSKTFVASGRLITPRIYAAKTSEDGQPHAERPPRNERGEAILAESFAIIDRELGSHPANRAERAIVRRAIHASADFEFARSLEFGPGAIDAAVSAFRSGAPIVTDVEMLRAGIRRDLTEPLGVKTLCSLNAVDATEASGSTRSAAGMRRSAGIVGDGAVIAIGNAPTALEAALDLVERESWRPACVIGIPVGFVGVEEAKRRLVEQLGVPFITSLGRKGGTAVTAAVVNALLDLAGGNRV
jgi:precorrin-3B C17-methyltransferase